MTDYTYGRLSYNGVIAASLYANVVRRGDSNQINGEELARTSGTEIWQGNSQVAYVKSGYVYSYGGDLLAKIGSSKVESVSYGDIYIDGASASDAGKGALWVALRRQGRGRSTATNTNRENSTDNAPCTSSPVIPADTAISKKDTTGDSEKSETAAYQTVRSLRDRRGIDAEEFKNRFATYQNALRRHERASIITFAGAALIGCFAIFAAINVSWIAILSKLATVGGSDVLSSLVGMVFVLLLLVLVLFVVFRLWAAMLLKDVQTAAHLVNDKIERLRESLSGQINGRDAPTLALAALNFELTLGEFQTVERSVEIFEPLRRTIQLLTVGLITAAISVLALWLAFTIRMSENQILFLVTWIAFVAAVLRLYLISWPKRLPEPQLAHSDSLSAPPIASEAAPANLDKGGPGRAPRWSSLVELDRIRRAKEHLFFELAVCLYFFRINAQLLPTGASTIVPSSSQHAQKEDQSNPVQS